MPTKTRIRSRPALAATIAAVLLSPAVGAAQDAPTASRLLGPATAAGEQRSLVFLDLGARYHDNGRSVRYLREGGIRDLPDGDVQLDVIRSRADLFTWHVGVSVGGR
jgi:hypothetical protein